MNRWILRATPNGVADLAKKYNITQLTAKAILLRTTIEDVDRYIGIEDELIEDLLNDIDVGANIIVDAIRNNKRICIVGDYDVDGVTATAILYRGLRELSHNVVYMLPHRVKDGYGINCNIVDKAVDLDVDVIITCDNGIAAFEALEYAKSKGLKVVLTDHHNLVIEEDEIFLPTADALINPKIGNYPFKEICGAMVAYKLIKQVYKNLDINLKVDKELKVLAAIGTVCDVMPLINENRTIVKQGISFANEVEIKGLKSIAQLTGINLKELTAYSLGFVIGPTLNSAGRLDSPQEAVELLITDDEERAYEIAKYLHELNATRKNMTNDAIIEAKSKIDGMDIDKNPVIVIHLKDIHESLAGIVAGRIKELYYRPTLIFTGKNDEVKGSARSISGYDLFLELSNIKEEFTKFGGHTMAAGFSSTEDKIEVIKKRLNKNSKLTSDDLERKLVVENLLPFKLVNVELINELEMLQPYGNGNVQPIYATTNVKIDSFVRIGKNKEYLKLKLNHLGTFIDAMCFNTDEEIQNIITNNEEIDVLYKLSLNEWNNIITPQLIIEDVRISK